MLELAKRALDRAVGGGAAYADARHVQTRHQELSVKDQALDGLTQDESEGIGVRVLVDGAWGFAATSNLTGPEVEATVEKALAIARASARVHRQPVDLGHRSSPPAATRARSRWIRSPSASTPRSRC